MWLHHAVHHEQFEQLELRFFLFFYFCFQEVWAHYGQNSWPPAHVLAVCVVHCVLNDGASAGGVHDGRCTTAVH